MSDGFHYIAVHGNQNTSGQCPTEDEAIKWAKAQMEKRSQIERAYIYQVLCVVERESPPIQVRQIPKILRSEVQPTGMVRKPLDLDI